MNKNDIYNLIGDRLNEMFWEVMKESGVNAGDIAPDDALKLESIQNELTDLIEKVTNYNIPGFRG